MEDSIKWPALCAATLLFVAPMMEFEEVRRSKRVGERPLFPMVCMWANCLMWLLYGLQISDFFPTVVTNMVGLVFSTYYCAVYVWAAESAARRSEAFSLFAGTLLVIGATCTFCFGNITAEHVVEDGNGQRQGWVGTAAALSTVVQYASPLALLVKVVRRRSTEGLSRPLAVVSLICGFLWLWYGVLTQNPCIYVPNLLGSIFSGIQCLLFLVYPRNSGDENKKSGRKEKVSV